jgi:hypothetical protein
MPKLKVGDIILVHGFVMMKGLKDGKKYRVQSMPKLKMFYDAETYQFTKAFGTKFVCRHLAESVDCWIGQPENLNRIEILKNLAGKTHIFPAKQPKEAKPEERSDYDPNQCS